MSKRTVTKLIVRPAFWWLSTIVGWVTLAMLLAMWLGGGQ